MLPAVPLLPSRLSVAKGDPADYANVIIAKYLEVIVRDAIRARNWSLVLHRSISLNRESLHIYISKHMHTTKEQSGASTACVKINTFIVIK